MTPSLATLIARVPVLQLVLVVVVTGAAGLTFDAVFLPADLIGPLVLAAVGSALGVVVLRAWQRPPHLAISVSANFALFLVFCAAVLFRETAAAVVVPTPATVEAMIIGTRDGWALILSSLVPAPAWPEMLFVPVTLTWVGSFVATELLLRTRRTLLLLAPSAVIGVAGLLFSFEAAGQRPRGLMVWLVLAAATLGLRAHDVDAHEQPPDRRGRTDPDGDSGGRAQHAALLRQRVLTTVPIVVVVVILAPAVAGRLPFVSEDPVELRDHYEITDEQRVDRSPLAAVEANEDHLAFRAILDNSPPAPLRFRTLVLDRFDGRLWESSSEFVTVGELLPIREDAPPARRVEQEIMLGEAPSAWLPALDRPVEVRAPDAPVVQVDPLSGTLLAADEDVTGLSYTVVSEVTEIDPGQLLGAGVATDDEARATVDLSGDLELPAELLELRDEVMGQASTPFQQMARLVAFFRNDPVVNTGNEFTLQEEGEAQGRAGFSLGHLARFVLDEPGGRTGSAEQFAASFVALARSQGFPARLAMGYVVHAVPAAGEPIEVLASELTAWAEVALDGLGWVAFDPTPVDEDESELQEEILDAAVDEAVDQSVNEHEGPEGENPNVGDEADDDATSGLGRATTVLLLALSVLVLSTALLVLPLVRKRRRRAHRRRVGPPQARIAGAWDEVVDRLIEVGEDEAPNRTITEVSLVAEERFGEQASRELTSMGALVNRAAHAADVPGETMVEPAWEACDEFSQIVRSQLNRRERLRAALSWKPLARGRVTAKPPSDRHR